MKKVLIFLILWIGLLTLVYLLYSDEKTEVKSKSEIHKQVEILEAKYGNKLYKAFFSIEELRPFSIVQIDKILESYDNTWISPSVIVLKLDVKEKALLVRRVTEYIESNEDEGKRKQIILKLLNWCKADSQFEFMNDELGIIKDDIMKVIESSYVDKQAISSNTIQNIALANETDKEKKDFAYYQTLNLISTFTTKEQMKYYGNIYIQLASLENK